MPRYGATAALFTIDPQTIQYLRLTDRSPARAGETGRDHARQAGFWHTDLQIARNYERVLAFDLSTVVRNIAGPSNPHRRLPTAALAGSSIARGPRSPAACPMARSSSPPSRAASTSNPRNVIAAALLAPPARPPRLSRKPWVKTSLAPGSKAVGWPQEAGLLGALEAGLRHRRLRLHHLQRHERRA